MRSLILDTSVYVDYFREKKSNLHLFEAQSTLYLSTVVVQELYAGAVNPFAIKTLDHFYEAFKKHQRVLTPLEDEWRQCGKLIAKIAEQHGYESVRKGRLVNDVLIAYAAVRVNAVLLTLNLKDFNIIAEFIPLECQEPA